VERDRIQKAGRPTINGVEVKEETGLAPGIRRNFDQIFQTAEWSLSKETLIPTLILLYSAIDIAAGLASTDTEQKVGKRFVRWVNDYIVPEKSLGCTAQDLYGARCGLSHSFSPISDLSQSRKAKQVLYSWGKSNPAKLREMISRMRKDDKDDYVVIHADGLLKAARDAIENFLQDVAKTPAKLERINRKALLVFGKATDADVDDFLKLGG
jgi:hypothetical protein